MKQKQIIMACKVLNKLYEKDLSLSVSYKLFRLRNMLRDQWEFQQEKESALFEKYNPTVGLDGVLDFGSKEQEESFRHEFNDLMKEMAEMDVDIGDFNKITLHLDDNLDLSMSDIDALSDFIDFVE